MRVFPEETGIRIHRQDNLPLPVWQGVTYPVESNIENKVPQERNFALSCRDIHPQCGRVLFKCQDVQQLSSDSRASCLELSVALLTSLVFVLRFALEDTTGFHPKSLTQLSNVLLGKP